MKEVKEEKRETLRNEQNNRFQGKNSVIVKKPKTLNTKKGCWPTTPKHTCRVFCLLSLWSPHGHLSSSYTLFIAKVSLILFFFLLSVFCLFLGGCVSFFVSIFVFFVLFVFDFVVFFLHFLFVWPKKPDLISEYLKCSFWCSVLVPASSHFHLAQLRTPTRTRESPLKMVFVSFLWFLTMCWNTYFTMFLEHQPKFPPIKMGPKENDNLSQCAKPKLVF